MWHGVLEHTLKQGFRTMDWGQMTLFGDKAEDRST